MSCHKVQLKVVGGKCMGETMKVGETFVIDGKTPEGICIGAFSAAIPYVLALRYGGNFPWEKQEGYGRIRCPDPLGGILMEIQRIPS